MSSGQRYEGKALISSPAGGGWDSGPSPASRRTAMPVGRCRGAPGPLSKAHIRSRFVHRSSGQKPGNQKIY